MRLTLIYPSVGRKDNKPYVRAWQMEPLSMALLAWGGYLVSTGRATVGEVTTVVLYIQQLADPVDRLLSWLDEVQVGGASFARASPIITNPPDGIHVGRRT